MEYNEQSILKALIYSSIFQYPLTKDELWEYAISEKNLDKKKFLTAISKNLHIQQKQNYYFLSGEESTVFLRTSRQQIAKQKNLIAVKISNILSLLPTIMFIGVSGSLSMDNTREEDDIDLFIITKKQTVWITRIIMLILLELLGKRRKKNMTRVNNKICCNLLMEESVLAFPSSMQNLYTAHEIAQVKPLVNRNQTYEKFISANLWVKNFLPNAGARISPLVEEWSLGRSGLGFLNFLAKRVQLWYMKRHRTSEIITDTVLAFYTSKMQDRVLKLYIEKTKKYAI